MKRRAAAADGESIFSVQTLRNCAVTIHNYNIIINKSYIAMFLM